ncbi:unnamed protein product [Sphenostylis stenocarpa]|uniref:Uncharacterized protein n=1 Tax=Sphenostylis stenocarpa TaxID=92480 RepID=A0AA86TAM8_9FABA|nr:unnamed protein product [Sphenostylis stenocarpa]
MLDSPGVDELWDLAAKPKTLSTQTLKKCKKWLVDGDDDDDDDDVCDKGRGDGFERVMMMKGEREWEGGGGHDDNWCCVMSLIGWRKIQGSLCHSSLMSKRKRLIGMSRGDKESSRISWC